ncbi:MAG: MarR family transcriptional regulator [Burkholderiaceae bacterium]
MDAADPTPEDVFEAIHTVMHLVRGQHHREQSDGADALTRMDGKVLSFFARNAGATQKDLATHSGRDKGQLARLIAGLRERGLLEGHPDADDGRNICLHLTDQGRLAQRQMQRQSRRAYERAAQSLTGEERRQLVRLLGKIGEGLAPRA